MKKVLVLIKVIKSIFISTAVASLILAVCASGNDNMTIKLTLLFISSMIFCLPLALLEEMIKDRIEKSEASEKRHDDINQHINQWGCRREST